MWSGLLLLWAAMQFAGQARWRPLYAAAPVLAVVWAWYGVFVMHSMATAGLSSALLLSAVTLRTAYVFMRHNRHAPSTGARLLAWTFLLWALHHLDYPLLRAQGFRTCLMNKDEAIVEALHEYGYMFAQRIECHGER